MRKKKVTVNTLENKNKNWTETEDEYLLDRLTKDSYTEIAVALSRTERSIALRVEGKRLTVKAQVDGIILKELAKVTTLDYGTLKNHITKKKLKAKRTMLRSKKVYVIKAEDFWKWAEEHKSLINFYKIERNIIIPEPGWVDKQRLEDKKNFGIGKKTVFTKEEEKIIFKLRAEGLSYSKIAKKFEGKSIEQVRYVFREQGLKSDIVRINWTLEEEMIREKMELEGKEDKEIAEELGRDEEHIWKHRHILRKNGRYEGYKKDRVVGA